MCINLTILFFVNLRNISPRLLNVLINAVAAKNMKLHSTKQLFHWFTRQGNRGTPGTSGRSGSQGPPVSNRMTGMPQCGSPRALSNCLTGMPTFAADYSSAKSDSCYFGFALPLLIIG